MPFRHVWISHEEKEAPSVGKVTPAQTAGHTKCLSTLLGSQCHNATDAIDLPSPLTPHLPLFFLFKLCTYMLIYGLLCYTSKPVPVSIVFIYPSFILHLSSAVLVIAQLSENR